jgi:hypothetical protein
MEKFYSIVRGLGLMRDHQRSLVGHTGQLD